MRPPGNRRLNDLAETQTKALVKAAEAEGFEPPDGCPSSAFKADAFGRSATLPWWSD
jgi:hypothetical protein